MKHIFHIGFELRAYTFYSCTFNQKHIEFTHVCIELTNPLYSILPIIVIRISPPLFLILSSNTNE